MTVFALIILKILFFIFLRIQAFLAAKSPRLRKPQMFIAISLFLYYNGEEELVFLILINYLYSPQKRPNSSPIAVVSSLCECTST